MSDDDDITPSWADVILRAMDSRLCELHVALPGRVETYDPATQTADVKPMIQNVVREEAGTELVPEELPVVPTVPVLFPRAGAFFVSLPVKPGDFGMLVFNERSIDRFRAIGEDDPPGDNRCHSLAGATFLPCALVPSKQKLADAHPDNLVVGRDGGSAIHIRPDDEIHMPGDNASDVMALVSTVQQIIDAVAATVIVPGDGGAALKTAISAVILAGSSSVRAD